MRSPLVRRSRLTILAFLSTLALVACVGGSNVTATGRRPIFAVLFGHVAAPAGTGDLQVAGQLYTDSAAAMADSTSAVFGGFNPTSVTGDYLFTLFTAQARTLWINVEGVGITGSTELTDTVRAIRVRFDSVGGGHHDSLEVDLQLH